MIAIGIEMETETGSAIGIESGVIEGPGVHPLGVPPTLTTPPLLLPARAPDTGAEEEGNIPALPLHHHHLFLHLRRHHPHHLPKPATPYLQDRRLLKLVVAVLGEGAIVLVLEGVEVELEEAHRRRPRRKEVEGGGRSNSLASTSTVFLH